MKKGGTTLTQEYGVQLSDVIDRQKKYSMRENKLRNMKWGMGVEHEAQYFYFPFLKNKNLNEIVVFNSEEPTKYLDKSSNTLEGAKDLLSKIAWEETGRKCRKKVVLQKLMYQGEGFTMPEFITENPFSTIKNKKTVENYYIQLLEKETKFVELMVNVPYVYKFLLKNNLSIRQYPFGMASWIKVRKNYQSDSLELEDKVYQDYCGSFHFTITLPFEKKKKYTKKDELQFAKEHYNFGAMLQWIEPLLVAAFFSTDQRAVGTLEKRIKGSFRVARVGWGNFAGSDMRKPQKGVGRYADVKPYWRKDFDFYQSDITMLCYPPNYKLKNGEDEFGNPRTMQSYNGVSTFSSNIRTFGPSTIDPSARISGETMKIPNGIEIRIFDHFHTINLLPLLKIIILVAANSKRTEVNKFVYQDEDWIKMLQDIMLHGWKVKVEQSFLNKLEEVYKLKLKPKTMKAWDVLDDMVDKLYEENKNSDVVFMMYGDEEPDRPFLPQINRYSWELAFMLKLVSNKNDYKNFLLFLEDIKNYRTTKELRELVVKHFGKKWINNRRDVMYFLENKEIIKLSMNEKNYKINNKIIKEYFSFETLLLEISYIFDPRTLFLNKKYKKRFKNIFNFDSSIYNKFISATTKLF